MSESEKALCDNVEEGDIEHSIVEGPPAAGCREDSERWRNIFLFRFIDFRYLCILDSVCVESLGQ